MAKRKIGPFELEKRLGVGGMGVVYRARYLKTGERVALKVLTPALSGDPKIMSRFEREIAILKKLKDPHIVRYYGGGEHGSQRFYAMELMEGGALSDEIKQKGRLSWERTVEVALQIAKALEHAHYHGVIHRDLKPANLFKNTLGQVKLGDFGIARDTSATALTAAGKTVGTYSYMAPEQIDGQHEITGKTDLYALGCVMFEMLTGKPPFEAENPAEMFFKHLEEEPASVRGVAIDCPLWLDQLVQKLLAKEPGDRFYDAIATQVALEDIHTKVAQQAGVSQQTVAGGMTSVATRADDPELQKIISRKKKKKHKKQVPIHERAWFLSLCLAGVVGIVTWSLWPLSEQELFANAEELMASEDPSDWNDARRKYLEPLLEKYPDGEYAVQASNFIDKIEMHKAERRAISNAKRGKAPETEAERRFIEAWRLEQFGDRITALEKYRSMEVLLKGTENEERDRPFINLARKQIEKLRDAAEGPQERVEIVNAKLKEADELLLSGQRLSAAKIWDSVINLYATNLELETQVKWARLRLEGKEPNFSPPYEASTEPASDENSESTSENTTPSTP